eukprot:TRINITY_DN24645_c0_g1_i1.p1 TRINITY_DN24645_c0_g1~~TRINITY_DN24645_c0_g1_i1.p1  ORF type:complete len:192 (+),score=14.63 TRINITY_DN24645_c0_g1_i1:1-576(+)
MCTFSRMVIMGGPTTYFGNGFRVFGLSDQSFWDDIRIVNYKGDGIWMVHSDGCHITNLNFIGTENHPDWLLYSNVNGLHFAGGVTGISIATTRFVNMNNAILLDNTYKPGTGVIYIVSCTFSAIFRGIAIFDTGSYIYVSHTYFGGALYDAVINCYFYFSCFLFLLFFIYSCFVLCACRFLLIQVIMANYK